MIPQAIRDRRTTHWGVRLSITRPVASGGRGLIVPVRDDGQLAGFTVRAYTVRSSCEFIAGHPGEEPLACREEGHGIHARGTLLRKEARFPEPTLEDP